MFRLMIVLYWVKESTHSLGLTHTHTNQFYKCLVFNDDARVERLDENISLWESFMEICHTLLVNHFTAFFFLLYLFSCFSLSSFCFSSSSKQPHTLHIKHFIYRFSPSYYVSMVCHHNWVAFFRCCFVYLSCRCFHIRFPEWKERRRKKNYFTRSRITVKLYCYVYASCTHNISSFFFLSHILSIRFSVISIQLHIGIQFTGLFDDVSV